MPVDLASVGPGALGATPSPIKHPEEVDEGAAQWTLGEYSGGVEAVLHLAVAAMGLC